MSELNLSKWVKTLPANHRARLELSAILSALKAVEFVEGFCESCDGDERGEGHRKDCQLDAAIKLAGG